MDWLFAWGLSRWRECRGLLHRLWWLRDQVRRILIGATSATIAFVWFTLPPEGLSAYLAEPNNLGIVFESIAVSTLVLGAVNFWARQRVDFVLERLPPLGPSDIRLRDGERVIPFRDQALLHMPAADRLLDAARNPLVYQPRPVPVHPLVQELLPLFIARLPDAQLDTTDDAKLRLGSDLTPSLLQRGDPVHLQATSYFRDRLTNSLANYRVRLQGRQLLDLRHEVLEPDGELMLLKTSPLANQLGASTLLVTADAQVVYLRQGNRVAENRQRLAPSGSGSFDRPAPARLGTMSFQDLARQEARRELREECGLQASDIVALRLCAFGRYLYRNGKPEVFCLARTQRYASDIQVPVREWDFQQRQVERHAFDGPVDAPQLAQALDVLRLKLERGAAGFENVSGPLYWAVVLARDDLLQMDEASRRAFFGAV